MHHVEKKYLQSRAIMHARKYRFFKFILLLAGIDSIQLDIKQPHTWNVCLAVYQIQYYP